MLRILFFLALLTSSTVEAATVTTKTTVTNSAWTDLGAGPMLLSFRGSGVYAISDATPSLVAEGFTLAAGDSVALNTTSHVWAMAPSSLGVDAYVAPITPSSGGSGGGITSITAGTTPTTGFTAGQLMMSDGTKTQSSVGGLSIDAGTTYAGWINLSAPNGVITSKGLSVNGNAGGNLIAVDGTTTLNFGISTGKFGFFNNATGTSPNIVKVYNTFTDASNGEWGALDWQTTPNVLTIGTQANGTGTARGLKLVSGSTVLMDYGWNLPTTLVFDGNVGSNNSTLGTPGWPWNTVYAQVYVSTVPQPTITGAGGACATSTKVGGATVGTVVLSGVCATTNTIAFTGMPAVTNGYACDAEDRTTRTAGPFIESASTTTGFTLTTGAVSSVAGDILQWKCLGY